MAATREHRKAKLLARLEVVARALEKEAARSDHWESGLVDPDTGLVLDHGDCAESVRKAIRAIKTGDPHHG